MPKVNLDGKPAPTNDGKKYAVKITYADGFAAYLERDGVTAWDQRVATLYANDYFDRHKGDANDPPVSVEPVEAGKLG